MTTDKTEEKLRLMLDAKGATYNQRQLRRIRNVVHDESVAIIFDILSGKPVDAALRESTMRSLSPAVADAWKLMEEHGYISSAEIIAATGIKPSTAANRMVELARSGLATRVFSYIPPGGGRRYYYGPSDKEHTKEAVQAFVDSLDGGTFFWNGH